MAETYFLADSATWVAISGRHRVFGPRAPGDGGQDDARKLSVDAYTDPAHPRPTGPPSVTLMPDASKPIDRTLAAKLVAEAVGTFALIYVGILVLAHGGGAGLTGIALAHGLAIAVMVSATMSISGGHLNPAVTLGALVGGKIKPADAGLYVVAQLVGGLAAGYLAQLSLGTRSIVPGVPDLGFGVSPATGILVEAILTFFLVFVVYGTGIDSRFAGRIGGLAIGLTVALDILAGGPLTGAAMNPARWFGAAVPAGHYANALVYIAGPALGGALAGWLYSRVLLPKENPA
jgi:MIP family channel proteins